MRKVKYWMIIIVAMFALFLMSNKAKAAVNYTRTFPSNDGTIIINLTGVAFDTKKAYSYALVTRGETPKDWHTITEYTQTTAQIKFNPATKDILEVLRVTDTGMLYVKNNEDNSYIVEALEINLKLPYLQAVSYSCSDLGSYSIANIYGIGPLAGDSYFVFQKITDKTLIEQFLKIKNNNGDITVLEKYLPTVPKNGYKKERSFGSKAYNDGLYLLWIKLTRDSCKDIYGCIVHDGLPKAKTLAEYIGEIDTVAPTVKSIEVTSPVAGTYKTSQTIKIQVKFSEVITGSSVPTLKIKFGESAQRSITNGIIKNDYIEYSYNIQDSDKGQLATVSLSGGGIKDASGNEAKLSCPIISGYAIKANEEGIENNKTDNQDTNQDKTDKDKDKVDNPNNDNINLDNNNDNTDNNNEHSDNSDNNNQDKTVAPNRLPQTGLGIGITVAIVVIVAMGVLTYFKYNSYRDIK